MRCLVAIVISGCQIDLLVGDAPIDSSPIVELDAGIEDAATGVDSGSPDAGTVDSGSADSGEPPQMRRFDVGAASMVMCADSLGGREADFAGFDAAAFNLSSGDLTYDVMISTLILSGQLLVDPFETSRIVLEEGVVPDQPNGTYLGAVAIQNGIDGPDNTKVNLAALYLDAALSPPRGEAGFQFETPSADGACFVSFAITIEP